LEISTLVFLAARKQNTNKTKKERKPEKELLEHNSMLPRPKS
jgi:hypothetical protein